MLSAMEPATPMPDTDTERESAETLLGYAEWCAKLAAECMIPAIADELWAISRHLRHQAETLSGSPQLRKAS